MKRPRIGITVDYNDRRDGYESPCAYAAAVEKAGGLPLLLPYRVDPALIPQYVDLIDGMLFTGGDDLDPSLYGEDWHCRVEPIDPQRQSFETALMQEVEGRRLPTMGICLGSQLMNVHRGGSLIQFLPEHPRPGALEHRKGAQPPWNRHDVTIEPGSILEKAIGATRLSVNTSHKQGMNQIGRGLKVIARSGDGIVEALEDPSLPLWFAVQWHPERLTDEPEHLALFHVLVEQSRMVADSRQSSAETQSGVSEKPWELP